MENIELNEYDLLTLRQGLFAIRHEPLIDMSPDDFKEIDNKLCELIAKQR